MYIFLYDKEAVLYQVDIPSKISVLLVTVEREEETKTSRRRHELRTCCYQPSSLTDSPGNFIQAFPIILLQA
jgi:hypothetical protein